ncbi:hypothetical protein AN219_21855 [Streptomyces nanshensis]|nr:hypothetical protein AN219_21855 [Streptomyces nanshensis]
MRISAINRLTRTQKSAAAGLAAAAGVVALTAGAAPGANADAHKDRGPAKPVAGHSVNVADHPSTKAAKAATGDHATDNTRSHAPAHSPSPVKGEETKQVSASKPADKADEAEKAKQAEKAEEARGGAGQKADRSTRGDSLDGWIKQARAVMKEEGIPGSHQGIKKNIMRESGGDPNAMNDWDINAQKGTPSKGLLQTIQPTFDAYHVKGTKHEVTDPVANIVAACNYAADKYGSMDNVNSAY